MVGILIIAGITTGAFYVGKIVNSPPDIVPVVTSTPKPSPTSSTSLAPSGIDETVYTEGTRSANWRTYTNSDYNFSFKYPSDFSILTSVEPYYFLENEIITLSSSESEYKTPNYDQRAIFSISTTPSGSDICFRDQFNILMTNKKELNGILFFFGERGNAALGTTYGSTIYRTLRGQTCLEIVLTIRTSSDWNGIDLNKSKSSTVNANYKLNHILATFKFLN